jgi:hypothetical protein
VTSQLDVLKLTPAQRRHIDWLTIQFGPLQFVDRCTPVHDASGVAVITEPSKPIDVGPLLSGLNERSAIVIPFGEDPAFDFLKSKLTPHGVISPSGCDGPHQLWWGGLGQMDGLRRQASSAAPLVATSYPYWFDERPVAAWRVSAKRLGLDAQVDYANGTSAFDKVESVNKIWRNADRAVLWLDPHATLRRSPGLMETLACDVAFVRGNDGRARTDVLFLAKTSATETLLRAWLTLSEEFGDLPEGILFDEAWALVSSQQSLSTIWLPQSCDMTRDDPDAVLAAGDTAKRADDEYDIVPEIRAAQAAGRIAAPAPHLILDSGIQSGQTAAVLLCTDAFGDRSTLIERLEDIGTAFTHDGGGFGRLEIVICDGRDDIKRTLDAVERVGSAAIIVEPGSRIPHTFFSRLGAKNCGAELPFVSSPASTSPVTAVNHAFRQKGFSVHSTI